MKKKNRNCHVQLKYHTMTEPKWVVLLPGVKEDQMTGWYAFGRGLSDILWEDGKREAELQMLMLLELTWSHISACLNSHWALADCDQTRLSSLCRFLYLPISPDLPLHHIYNGVRSDPLDGPDREGNEVATKWPQILRTKGVCPESFPMRHILPRGSVKQLSCSSPRELWNHFSTFSLSLQSRM